VVLFSDLSDFETGNNRERQIKKQDIGKQLSHFLKRRLLRRRARNPKEK
jgi:hypothetical protein